VPDRDGYLVRLKQVAPRGRIFPAPAQHDGKSAAADPVRGYSQCWYFEDA
jgi:hypothetical protein